MECLNHRLAGTAASLCSGLLASAYRNTALTRRNFPTSCIYSYKIAANHAKTAHETLGSILGENVSIAVFLSNLVSSVWLSGVVLVQEQANAPADSENIEKLKELGSSLNETQVVQEASAGILQPIYQLAEYMAFPSFYWIAFAVMVAGVVSFAGQLFFTKLLLLFKLNLNFKEILGDLLGLLVSLTGLVLTTQAATQNSTFPENAAAVVSATAVGAVVGLVFYVWGQKQEFLAARQIPKNQRER